MLTLRGGLGRLFLAALIPSSLLVPRLAAAPVVRAGGFVSASTSTTSCSGYTSNSVPPNTIRVLVHDSSGGASVQVLGFENYVENVLPNEWYPSWNAESLKAGAMAAKMYAWYMELHWRGGELNNDPTQCYDVDDTQAYQVYRANSAQASTTAAVQAIWYTNALENGKVFEASYCSNMNCSYYTVNTGAPNNGQDLCGTDPSGNPNTNGLRMSQWGSQACAQKGLTYQQILGVYYYVTPSNPGLSFVTSTPPVPTLATFQADNGQLWTMGSLGWKNWGVGVAPGTSPTSMMLPGGGYELAFQANGGLLWTVGNAGWVNWGVGMAPGTSPSIMTLPKGGYEIAFQANGGALWTVGTAGWKNWGVGMAPGTSPSIMTLPNGGYEIAFQAYGGSLWTVGTAGWTNWGVGMAPASSPAAVGLPNGGYEIAFQAYGGSLWTVGTAGWKNWGPGGGCSTNSSSPIPCMAASTSPSIVALANSGFEVAMQASGGQLWTVGGTGTTNWGLAMAPQTSPSITVQPNGTLLEAYQGSDGGLWTVGSGGYAWSLGMAKSTSPMVR